MATKNKQKFSVGAMSAKKRGLIILLAFAVIGGAITVYRSFAATAQPSWTFTAAAKTIISGETPTSSPCKTTSVAAGTASTVGPVFNIACTTNAPNYNTSPPNTNPNAAYIVPKATLIEGTNLGKYYRLCAVAVGKGSAHISWNLGGSPGVGMGVGVLVNNKEKSYCTSAMPVSTKGYIFGRISTVDKDSSVTISSVKLEAVALPTTTTYFSAVPSNNKVVCEPAPAYGTTVYTNNGCSLTAKDGTTSVFSMATSGNTLRTSEFIVPKGSYKVCAEVKAVAGGVPKLLIPGGGPTPVDITNTTSYATRCGGKIDIIQPAVGETSQFWSYGGGTVLIRKIYAVKF